MSGEGRVLARDTVSAAPREYALAASSLVLGRYEKVGYGEEGDPTQRITYGPHCPTIASCYEYF